MKLFNNRKIINLLFLFTILIASSCSNEFGDEPDCFKDRFNSFKETACDKEATIDIYTFQDQEVYVFNYGFCIADGSSSVYTSECEYLGELGGFGGLLEINGEKKNSPQEFLMGSFYINYLSKVLVSLSKQNSSLTWLSTIYTYSIFIDCIYRYTSNRSFCFFSDFIFSFFCAIPVCINESTFLF